MKRILLGLGVGLAMFAVVAFAATLNVSGGTAATGQGPVDFCGDITGSTYILKGWGVASGPSGDDYMYDDPGIPNDITKAIAVNIETSADCNMINAFVAVKTDGGTVLGSGSCTISGNGTALSGTPDDGLGWDEGYESTDNVPGCTALLDSEVNVSAIEFLVVTET